MQVDRKNPLVVGFFETFKVPTRLTVTEWADKYRILPSKGSSEPGPYRSSRTPYTREIMDALSTSSPVEEVILIGGAQISKSETGNNWVGYVIDNAPGPMLLVQPTVDNAKRYSKQRITPMIQATPSLAEKVIDNKSRESGNTILEKEFPGGILILGGANSAAGLRSMPVRYLFADEISNWPQDVDGEGDPLELAEARTSTFGRKRKIFKCSTPGVKGECRIENEYLKTDQRKYFVPCPQCGVMHVLMWENFVIPVDAGGKKLPKQAHMVCLNGCIIDEHHKTDMLNHGEWRATCPENADPARVGYQISTLYSPVGWKSWAKIARQWIEAQGNPMKLQAFINNVLAETWNVKAERVDATGLMTRAEDYDAYELPEGAVVLTAGVDVQHDRLELEIVGWGIGEETWSIDYQVIVGDPTAPQVWQQLDQHLLNRTFLHKPSGVTLRIARSLVDSGDRAVRVYEYCGPREAMGVYACKGSSQGENVPLVGAPNRKNAGKVPLFTVGTIAAKDLIYGRLKLDESGPGYCHFPKRHGAAFYEQLTSNYTKDKWHRGFKTREYNKDPLKRDEALDCRVYATAAFYSLGVNVQQIVDALGAQAPQQGRRVRGGIEQ